MHTLCTSCLLPCIPVKVPQLTVHTASIPLPNPNVRKKEACTYVGMGADSVRYESLVQC